MAEMLGRKKYAPPRTTTKVGKPEIRWRTGQPGIENVSVGRPKGKRLVPNRGSVSSSRP